MRLLLAGLLLAGAALAETWSYWIEPCTPDLAKQSGCTSADAELGIWALEAWQKASVGELRVAAASEEDRARIRIYWAWGTQSLYGEARPIVVDGKRGAAIFVIPDMARLGPDIDAVAKRDPLFRDAVVYLTCLHESGHAIGLPHTAQFADIMYSFGFGGDIVEYFGRYRRALTSRQRIPDHSGISPGDRGKLAAIFKK
jgi:hypothetical protein